MSYLEDEASGPEKRHQRVLFPHQTATSTTTTTTTSTTSSPKRHRPSTQNDVVVAWTRLPSSLMDQNSLRSPNLWFKADIQQTPRGHKLSTAKTTIENNTTNHTSLPKPNNPKRRRFLMLTKVEECPKRPLAYRASLRT